MKSEADVFMILSLLRKRVRLVQGHRADEWQNVGYADINVCFPPMSGVSFAKLKAAAHVVMQCCPRCVLWARAKSKPAREDSILLSYFLSKSLASLGDATVDDTGQREKKQKLLEFYKQLELRACSGVGICVPAKSASYHSPNKRVSGGGACGVIKLRRWNPHEWE